VPFAGCRPVPYNRRVQEIPLPKIKTHKGAAKRFQFSGSGKLQRTHHNKTHFRRNKRKSTLRELDDMHVVKVHADAKRIAQLIPYGGK
jgi:ribosomal protein L35